MAKGNSATGVELATTVYTAAIGATGRTSLGVLSGYFNFFLSGTFSATVRLEKSYDGGTTWIPVSLDTSGTAASYTAPTSIAGFECELGMLYAVNCTAYVSGAANVRLSQNLNTNNYAVRG